MAWDSSRVDPPWVMLALVALIVTVGCGHDDRKPAHERAASSAPPSAKEADRRRAEEPRPGSAIAPPTSETTLATEKSCQPGMQRIAGGKFWIGSEPKERFSDDESPRFLTEIAPFCLDETEITVADYAACVERGICPPPKSNRFLCNYGKRERAQHPMNCVTYREAVTYCGAVGKRLPREHEWEFAARGGDHYWEYPWGNEPPDGRTCWKRGLSCKVRSFPPGAFGLFDMSGNVWEWVDDYYGPYPWPPTPETGFSRVYRGGSWSRRFEKWMHTRLRNRGPESYAGSHLGLRCAESIASAPCPFGADDASGRCRVGVLEVSCRAPNVWNGARCSEQGAPRCREGWIEVPGHGCLPVARTAPPALDLEPQKAGVTRSPSPEFAADCRKNFRDRPHSFRYVGGSHTGRNLVSRSAGCKNRDVGVGFNSTCCP